MGYYIYIYIIYRDMGYGYSNPGMQTNDKCGNHGETIIELPSWKHFSASSLGFLYYTHIYIYDRLSICAVVKTRMDNPVIPGG